MADLVHNYVRTSYSLCSETSWNRVEGIFAELEERGHTQLERDNVPPADRRMTRALDMRYAGQSHELNVAVRGAQSLEEMVSRFHGVHERHYGYSMPGEEVAIVNYRLVAMGVRPKPVIESRERPSGDADVTPKGERRVHFNDEGWVRCCVYDRDLLKPGNVVHGPCVVEEWDTTTVVNDGYAGTVDGFGNLILAKGGKIV